MHDLMNTIIRGTRPRRQRENQPSRNVKFDVLSTLRSVLQLVLFLLCLFLLITYGGVASETVALSAICIFVLLPLALFTAGIPAHMRVVVAGAGFLLFILAGWTWLQAIPIDEFPFDQSHLRPSADPIWETVQTYLRPAHPAISLTPGDAGLGGLAVALPFGVFLSALILFQLEKHAHIALRWIALLGGGISLFSIIQFMAQPEVVLFVTKSAYRDSLTGVFVNRNTAATFFGLLFLLQCALAWQRVAELGLLRSFTALLNGAPFRHERVGLWGLAYSLCALTTLCALMLTKSRAGISASFLALICLIVLLLLFPPRSLVSRESGRSRLLLRIGLSLTVLFASAIAFVSMAGRVLFRGAAQDFDGRFCVASGIAAAIRAHLPWGAGLTSFREVFPAYRDVSCGIYLVWDRAHNLYAEGLFSLGIIFIPALLLGVGSFAAIYFYGLRTRRRQRHVGSLGLALLLLVTVHSFFDFSLQIPGVASFFAVLSALVTSICLLPAKQISKHATDCAGRGDEGDDARVPQREISGNREAKQ